MAQNREYARAEFAQWLPDDTNSVHFCRDGARAQDCKPDPVRDLFCRFTLDGTLTFVNQAYASYFQKPSDHLTGTNILDLVPLAARKSIHQQLQDLQLLTPEQPALTQEHEALAPDGSIRWHQWTNLAQFDDQGNIVELQAVGYDITERKTLEQDLRKSEQLLSLFFTQSLDGFFFAMLDEPVTWDASADKAALLNYVFDHLRITRVNQAFLDQYLAAKTEILGHTPAGFFAHNPETGRQTLQQLFDNGRLHAETRECRIDGTPVLIEGDYTCLYDDRQRLMGLFGVQRDVTDIKAAIRALAESEAKYRLLVENQTDIIVKIDPDYRFLFASPSYCELFDQSQEELLGKAFSPQIHEDDQASSQVAMALLRQPPHTCYLEQRVMTVRGWRWLAWSDRAILNAQGDIEAIVAVGRDITERKLAELTLQQSEERFRTAMAAAQVGTWDWNIQTGQIIWSETLEHLMGLKPGSFDGDFTTMQSMIFPDDRERVAAAIRAAIEENADYTIEFRFMRPDGGVRWALGKGDVIRDVQGKPIRMTGIDIDITERKQAELKLKESEARFRNVTTNLPGAVFRYRLCADGSDHITLMNQGCLDIWEIQPSQVADSPTLLWEMIQPEDRATVWTLVQQSAVSLTPWSCEWRIQTPSGKLKWLQGMGRPERLPNGDVVWDTLILDVSDRKKAELALTQTSQQLQSFLDNTPAMVALFDAEGHYLKVNQAGAELLGGNPEDFAGRAFADVLPSDTVKTFLARTVELVAHQNPMVVEDRLMIQGQERVLQTILFPVTVDSGGPIVLGSIATDVTPLVQAQTTLQRQADEERLIRAMTQHIRESLDLRQILQTTVTEIREFLNTDRVLVYRFHADWSGDMFVESVVPPWNAVVGSNIKDPCFEGDLVNQYLAGRISQIEDVEQADLTQCHKDLLAQFQVRANLTIPINCRGQLWGLLCVHHCQAPRLWQEDEIRLLRQISDQVAIAIQQAELYQQAQAELTERKRLEAQLRYEAFHDRLTALPNRTFFLDQLDRCLERLHQNCQQSSRDDCHFWNGTDKLACCPYQFAVLFLDLDRFKIINDSLGHTFGDNLLQIVAERLRTCLGNDHVAARLGGDEFVVLLTELETVNDATELALTIHRALEAPMLLQQHEVFVRASIGIAFSSPEYQEPSQILRDADIAMYQAKDGNREYAIFDAPMHTLAVQQMQLENDLRHAIDRQEFELHYQPIVALATGQLQGFEALIRWRHPERGLVPPLDFIPVAENTGLITEIDLWTLNQACRQMHQWHQQFSHHQRLTINVNLSGKQFVRSDLIEKIDQALITTGLQGEYLKLEITESVLIQNANLAIDILNQLKQRHITVCMDDFGTGYSSLSYLHRFPVDVLKIDKSFISSLHTEASKPGDDEIVRAIISLANSLNLSVVAEGIETPEQLDYLKANCCQGGQGYYYARPMAAPDVVPYLQAQR